MPLVGDFHFNGHRLLTDYPECAEALAKYRINPGNVGHGEKRDSQFATMIEIACRYDRPVRIGVNWGSLDSELIVRMMDENARSAQPKLAEQVMHEAMVESAIAQRRPRRGAGTAQGPYRAVLQDERRPGPDRASIAGWRAAETMPCTWG